MDISDDSDSEEEFMPGLYYHTDDESDSDDEYDTDSEGSEGDDDDDSDSEEEESYETIVDDKNPTGRPKGSTSANTRNEKLRIKTRNTAGSKAALRNKKEKQGEEQEVYANNRKNK